jgi:peptidoglycan/LPS O-acetylase OafA/YrhL
MSTTEPASESHILHRSTRLAELVQVANGINAARVFASLLVVIFHAAVPYMTSPIPLWVVHDTAQHISVDMLIFWVNGFAMPLFFLLGGWSIAKSSIQRPFLGFAWHRINRLGQTFLLALVLIVPILLLTWGIGLLYTERLTMANLTRLNFPSSLRSHLGPCHLWFLEYLLLLSIAWAAIARIGQRLPRLHGWIQGKYLEPILGSAWGALLLSVPAALILMFDMEAPFRLIPEFAIDTSRLMYYFVFLVGGVWLANQPRAYAILSAMAPLNLLMATAVFIVLDPLTLSVFARTLVDSARWLVVCLQPIFAWSMVLGFLGAAIRWCGRPNETIRYNHEASFWVYLAHLPVVCIVQLMLLEWQLQPWIKLSIAAASGFLISLISYELCVRYSFLGSVINGRRIQHVSQRGWRLEAGWLGLATLSILLIAVISGLGWNTICKNHLHQVNDNQIYRCNRPPLHELESILRSKEIRSLISLGLGRENDDWFREQRQICRELGISLVTLSLEESRIPTGDEIQQLQTTLSQISRPVLLVGGKRSPTLSGFGAAVATLMDDGSLEQALAQFDMRFFQLEGPERCIMAQPLREYRSWLRANGLRHSVDQFCRWTKTKQEDSEVAAKLRAIRTGWQATMGAPRYPRRF